MERGAVVIRYQRKVSHYSAAAAERTGCGGKLQFAELGLHVRRRFDRTWKSESETCTSPCPKITNLSAPMLPKVSCPSSRLANRSARRCSCSVASFLTWALTVGRGLWRG